MAGLLIIDDETELLEKIEFVLEDLIEEIFTADNGSRALEILENQDDICCVICDVNMPEQDGISIIKEVRAKSIKIPFIFYSGRADDVSMVESSEFGTFDFIMKPNIQELEKSTSLAIELGKRILSGEDINLVSESNATYKELVETLKS